MATHSGISGLVKVAANTVAEVTSWTLDQSNSLIEDTAMGDTSRTYLAGLDDFSASVEVFWDETDTNGQVALSPGSSVTLVLSPEGADAGDTSYTGTALVTSHSVSGSFDGMITASIGATYTGAVSTSTVS